MSFISILLLLVLAAAAAAAAAAATTTTTTTNYLFVCVCNNCSVGILVTWILPSNPFNYINGIKRPSLWLLKNLTCTLTPP